MIGNATRDNRGDSSPSRPDRGDDPGRAVTTAERPSVRLVTAGGRSPTPRMLPA